MADVKLIGASQANRLALLADYVYEVAENARFLVNYQVEEITTRDEIATLWGDLELLKKYLDKAEALARHMLND